MKRVLGLLAFVLIWSSNMYGQSNTTMPLTTIKGKTIHIAGTANGLDIKEYKGKVVFLEFWGTHCPPCLASIPHYVDMVKQYKGKLAMLGIEVQDTPKDRLKQFATAKEINYDVVAYRDAGYFTSYIAQRAGWKGQIPFLMILDTQGNVVTMQVGMLPHDVLKKVVDDLLSGKLKKH